MHRDRFISAIFLFLSCFPSMLVHAEPKVDILDFLKYAAARDLQISPDGKYLSIVFKKSGKDYLGILDRKTRRVIKTFGVRGRRKSVGHVYWVNNQRLVNTHNDSRCRISARGEACIFKA